MPTETLPPPPKKAPPPPAKAPPPVAAPVSNKTFTVSSGKKVTPIRACIYGTGGIGKSELAANISQLGMRVLFIDADKGSTKIDAHRVEGVESFDDVRSLLNSDLPGQFDALVFDTLTTIEQWSIEWVIRNVKHEKGNPITSIEDYGWGKGLVHNYENFLRLLGEFDNQVRAGKHVICVTHECTSNVPNPAGDDWLRYEPRLQSPKSGQNSIRHRVKEWVEHLFYVGYDVHTEDGKGRGAGSRTIYCQEMPAWWAKSRTLAAPIVYTKGSAEVWNQLLQKGE